MDAREFKQRFMPHYKLLYRVAYYLTGNAQDAEDLLQDMYLKLWQKRENLKEEADTQAYLVTMMKNLFVDQRRHKRLDASEDIEAHASPPDELSLDEQIGSQDEVQQVEGLIRQLSERDAKIIQMHLMEDRSYEEIESDTGLSQGNIRIIVMRAKKKLKQQFQNITDYRPRSTSGSKRRGNKRPSAVACCPTSCAIRLLPPASPSSLVWDITICDWTSL